MKFRKVFYFYLGSDFFRSPSLLFIFHTLCMLIPILFLFFFSDIYFHTLCMLIPILFLFFFSDIYFHPLCMLIPILFLFFFSNIYFHTLCMLIPILFLFLFSAIYFHTLCTLIPILYMLHFSAISECMSFHARNILRRRPLNEIPHAEFSLFPHVLHILSISPIPIMGAPSPPLSSVGAHASITLAIPV